MALLECATKEELIKVGEAHVSAVLWLQLTCIDAALPPASLDGQCSVAEATPAVASRSSRKRTQPRGIRGGG